MIEVNVWLTQAGLELAAYKSEAIVITNKRRHNDMNIIDNTVIWDAANLRYLGLALDSKFNFNFYAKLVAIKSQNVLNSLSQMMPNISAAKPRRRRLLGNVVQSIMLFDALIWADLTGRTGKEALLKVQRRVTLRTISAYLTVS